MKQSLISRIESYAKKNPFWISGQVYGRLADGAGYKADTASRRLRELAHPDWLLKQHPEKKNCKGCSDGILEHREINGYVEYKYKFAPGQKITMQEAREISINIANKHHEDMRAYLQSESREEDHPTPSESREESKQIALI